MLVVDDAEINRMVLRQLFQQDYVIAEAANGQEALHRLGQGPVSLILLDLVMPVMDGFELLAYLRRHDSYADLPVIVLAAAGDGDGAARAISIGATDFLTKPFNPLIVRRRVKNVLAGAENEWRKELEAAREEQLRAMHRSIEEDRLTGLYSREAFYRQARQLLEKNEGKEYDLLYFDVRSFKVINSLFRVETGNLVLKTAASYLEAIAGTGGLAARLEADHFALLLRRGTISYDLLMAGLDSTVHSLALSQEVTFYAGIYPVEDSYLPLSQMLDRAQLAEERAKQGLARRYAVYDQEMQEHLARRQMILRDMEFALQERQFEVYYQPIYNAKQGEIISAEALVRWQHPTEGLILPDDFVSLFEHNGFIVRLDHYVWERAASFAARERERTGHALPISVNLSRLNFYGLAFLDHLKEIVRRYGIEPWMLRLEVKESAYAGNARQISVATEACRAAGFRVILDGFGSGVSSLNLLKDLPVDALKLDLRFAWGAEDEARARIVLAGIAEVGKRLGLALIAEGVEHEEQIEYLEGLGCENIQGYYYAPPLTPEAFHARLKAGKGKDTPSIT